MADNSLSDRATAIDQSTNQVQPIQPTSTQKPFNSGLMDFSHFESAVKFCEIISKIEMCPKNYKGKPFEVMCAIQYGFEIGLSPLQAVQSIAVINGKPSIYGDGLMALCQSFSECEDIREEFDTDTMTATCTVVRKGRSPVVHSWNPDKAKKAKLWGKAGPWTEYPERMLQMRARGFALRDAFADRLKGIITAEEARDYPTQEERQPQLKVITPIRKEIQIQEPAAKEQTIKQLQFLTNRLVQQKPEAQKIIDKWLHKANVDNLVKLTERQALACIGKIEDEDSTAKRAWILHSRAEKVCKAVVEAMPHGFYDDFTDEQLQGAVNHV